MKKTNRILALLFVFVLVFGLMASCTNETTPPTEAPKQSATPSAEPSAEPTEEGYVYKMPITDGDNITIWRSWASNYLTNPNEILTYIEMEKRTGIKVTWNSVSNTDAGEQFNLLVASRDLPDIIFTSRTQYIGGNDKAIDDGIYLRLNEYLEKWGPSFMAHLNNDPDAYRQSITDGGNISNFSCIQEGLEPAWLGPMIRYDWLADMGKDVDDVVTYDDWREVLTYFKDEKGAIAPIHMLATGIDDLGFSFGQAGGFFNQNGTVRYGVATEEFRNYITILNQWFNEGLLGSDFTSNTSWWVIEPIANGESGIFIAMNAMSGIMKMQAADSNFNAGAISIPVFNKGDTAHFRRVNFIVGDNMAAVTPTAAVTEEHLENVIRWLDYRYSEEGGNLANYGVEGVTYELDEKGHPVFNELITNNPDGMTGPDAMNYYTDPMFGAYYMWIRNWAFLSDQEINNFSIWDKADGAYNMPNVTLTSDEGAAYSKLFTDISTFQNERLPRFINGTMPMSEWDGFIAQLESMGIEECIGYYQAALDRYNNR